MQFGEKLEKLCEVKRWSRNQVMRDLKQHSRTMQRWADGIGWPKYHELLELSRMFQVDPGWLMDDSKGWDDQPTYNLDTMLLAQAIQLINKLGAAEALRRLKGDTSEAA